MTNAAFLNSSIGHIAKDENKGGNDEEDSVPRANIFTVVAADSLMSTIRPAIEHILW